MGLPTARSRNEKNGVVGGGDIRPPPTEYRHPVYHDSSDTGAMPGGRATDGIASDTEVVRIGQNQLCERVRECGGADKGGRVRGGYGGQHGDGADGERGDEE